MDNNFSNDASNSFIEEASSSQRQKILKALIFDDIICSGEIGKYENKEDGNHMTDFSSQTLHPEELGMHVSIAINMYIMYHHVCLIQHSFSFLKLQELTIEPLDNVK